MPKLNPLTLKRASAVTETRTFTDLLQPDAELEVTLKVSPDVATDTLRGERASEFARTYLLGDAKYQQTKDSGKPEGEPPADLFVQTDGKPEKLVVTLQLCQIIAELTYSEEAALGGADGCYDFRDWLLISRSMPSAFEEVALWHDELREKARGRAKNRPGASGEAMYPSPSSGA